MSSEPVLSAGDVERLVLRTFSKPRSMSGFSIPASQETPSFDFKILTDPPLPSATITDLCNEPLFHSGYHSEEEDMSSDDMSFSSVSANDDFVDDFDASFAELLADDCTFVEQQCNQAEAVTLVSPGKAKIVRVSRVDFASTPAVKRPPISSTSSTPRNYSRLSSRLSLLSHRAHSHDGSMASGSPRMPSTPPLEEGATTPSSFGGPATPQTPDSSFFDPLAGPIYAINVTSTPTPKPRFRDSYRLRLSSSTKRAGPVPTIEAPLSAPLTSTPSFKQKMLARGTGERIPSLELLPFNRDQLPKAPKSARPSFLRKDTFSLLGLDQPSGSGKLRRAESGPLPTWR